MADFKLIDLSSNISFTFQYFPETVTTSDRANWEAQNLTTGHKPLFYSNREPMQISVENLVLDNADTGRSLRLDLEDLRTLMEEVDGQGAPPPLLAIWGDHKERCVLQDLTIEEEMFNDDGACIRARIAIQLTELQPDGEGTTVRTSTYNENIDPGG
jgi:hypothetical protein